MPDPALKGSELVKQLEDWQQELIDLVDVIRPYKEPRSEAARCVSLAITKLDEARMWLAEAIMETPR